MAASSVNSSLQTCFLHRSFLADRATAHSLLDFVPLPDQKRLAATSKLWNFVVWHSDIDNLVDPFHKIYQLFLAVRESLGFTCEQASASSLPAPVSLLEQRYSQLEKQLGVLNAKQFEDALYSFVYSAMKDLNAEGVAVLFKEYKNVLLNLEQYSIHKAQLIAEKFIKEYELCRAGQAMAEKSPEKDTARIYQLLLEILTPSKLQFKMMTLFSFVSTSFPYRFEWSPAEIFQSNLECRRVQPDFKDVLQLLWKKMVVLGRPNSLAILHHARAHISPAHFEDFLSQAINNAEYVHDANSLINKLSLIITFKFQFKKYFTIQKDISQLLSDWRGPLRNEFDVHKIYWLLHGIIDKAKPFGDAIAREILMILCHHTQMNFEHVYYDHSPIGVLPKKYFAWDQSERRMQWSGVLPKITEQLGCSREEFLQDLEAYNVQCVMAHLEDHLSAESLIHWAKLRDPANRAKVANSLGARLLEFCDPFDPRIAVPFRFRENSLAMTVPFDMIQFAYHLSDPALQAQFFGNIFDSFNAQYSNLYSKEGSGPAKALLATAKEAWMLAASELDPAEALEEQKGVDSVSFSSLAAAQCSELEQRCVVRDGNLEAVYFAIRAEKIHQEITEQAANFYDPFQGGYLNAQFFQIFALGKEVMQLPFGEIRSDRAKQVTALLTQLCFGVNTKHNSLHPTIQATAEQTQQRFTINAEDMLRIGSLSTTQLIQFLEDMVSWPEGILKVMTLETLVTMMHWPLDPLATPISPAAAKDWVYIQSRVMEKYATKNSPNDSPAIQEKRLRVAQAIPDPLIREETLASLKKR